MHSSLWHFASFFPLWPGSFVLGAAVFIKPSVLASILQPQHLVNSTLLTAVPAEFTAIVQSPRGPTLPGILCLEATVQIIGEHLALEDFTGGIPTQGWTFVKLVVAAATKGPSANTIERRYVMWGLLLALEEMIKENDFRSAVFLLEWRGDIVGSVAFYPEDSPTLKALNPSANATTQLLSQPSFLGDGANGSVSSIIKPLGIPMKLVFSQLEPVRPIDRYGMLINIIDVLTGAAEFPASEIVRDRYMSSLGAFGVQVYISGKGGVEPPSSPPFLTYRWIILAMTAVPASLAMLGIYTSFKMEVFLDHVSIAEVVVIPNPFRQASVNVSTA